MVRTRDVQPDNPQRPRLLAESTWMAEMIFCKGCAGYTSQSEDGDNGRGGNLRRLQEQRTDSGRSGTRWQR